MDAARNEEGGSRGRSFNCRRAGFDFGLIRVTLCGLFGPLFTEIVLNCFVRDPQNDDERRRRSRYVRRFPGGVSIVVVVHEAARYLGGEHSLGLYCIRSLR